MSALLGAPLPRQDGPAKVTGAARYAADHFAEGMLYGVLVGAPVPAGRLRAIDTDAARDIPAVTHVFTHAEMPSLRPPPVPPASSVRGITAPPATNRQSGQTLGTSPLADARATARCPGSSAPMGFGAPFS